MWKVKKSSGGAGGPRGETPRVYTMTKSNNSLDERNQAGSNKNDKKEADDGEYKPVKVSEMRKRFERSNI